MLSVPRLVPVDDLDFGFRIEKVFELLVTPPALNSEATGFTDLPLDFANVGIFPLVKQLCRDRGINLAKARRENPLASLPPPAERPVGFSGLKDFVQQNETGIIETNKPADVIAELATAFRGPPLIYMVVLASKKERLTKCEVKLKRLFSEDEHQFIQRVDAMHPVTFDGDKPLQGILLSTFAESGGIDLEKAHMVVFLDAAECLHERASMPLTTANAAGRLYGIRKPHSKVESLHEEAVVMRVFGPEVISFRGLATRRDAAVHWLPFNRTGRNHSNKHSTNLLHRQL